MRCLLKLIFWFLAICLIATTISYCSHSIDSQKHDELTAGCVMVGTIQGYQVGRGTMPSQEQWNCNGMMRTVNSVE